MHDGLITVGYMFAISTDSVSIFCGLFLHNFILTISPKLLDSSNQIIKVSRLAEVQLSRHHTTVQEKTEEKNTITIQPTPQFSV